jgi:hypothetical protein
MRRITLHSLKCFEPEDFWGDECKLAIIVDGVLQPILRKGDVDDGERWHLNRSYTFNHKVEIKLWDEDSDSDDDFLGSVLIDTKLVNEATGSFKRDGANYKLWYSVVNSPRDNSPGQLYLILRTLVCQVTEDDSGADETYIKVNGRRVWGPHDMNSGHTYHLYRCFPVQERDQIKIELRDQDPWYEPDDPLGTEKITAKEGEYVLKFRKNYSFYSLFIAFEYDRKPSRLEIVEPSLGHPFVCKPGDLWRLRTKIATRNILGDIYKACDNLMSSVFLEDSETGQRFSCTINSINKGKIQINRDKYEQLRKQLNRYQSRFPKTNDEFRAGCGITTDLPVTISPSVSLEELKGQRNWPRMFNLRLGNQVVYHCIFVSETLTDAENLKFLHVTDSHISLSNDIIQKDIDESENVTVAQKKLMRTIYRNPNDHLRAIIQYANEKQVDFIAITGDVVDQCSTGWLNYKQPHNTNFRYFQNLITGKDGNGQSLKCPVFIVPGNHEFNAFAPPLRFNMIIPDFWKAINPLAGDLELAQRTNALDATGLNGEFGSKKYADLLDKLAYKTADLHLKVAFTFLLPTYPQFFQYLTEISYELSYEVKTDQCQLVFLNTGQDVKIPKVNASGLLDYIQKTDAVSGGTHNSGFNDEDKNLIRNNLGHSSQPGLAFVFCHAPLLNFEDNLQMPEFLTENYHEAIEELPPNQITRWFIDNFAPYPDTSSVEHDQAERMKREHEIKTSNLLEARGFPQAGSKYFYKNDHRGKHLDFGCAEEGYKDVIDLTTKQMTASQPRVAAVLSGHTHKVRELRVTSGYRGEFCVYTDNYSGSARWTGLPKGNSENRLPDSKDKSKWLNDHAPLLLTSGGLKGKLKPQFREVIVEDGTLQSIEMKEIERYRDPELISLRSKKFPTLFIRHSHITTESPEEVETEVVEVQSKQESYGVNFKLLPGLGNSRCISFESVDLPGYYLSAETSGSNIKVCKYDEYYLDKESDEKTIKKYRERFTFKPHPGLSDPKGLSFESNISSDLYLCYSNFRLTLGRKSSDASFKGDATFLMEEAIQFKPRRLMVEYLECRSTNRRGDPDRCSIGISTDYEYNRVGSKQLKAGDKWTFSGGRYQNIYGYQNIFDFNIQAKIHINAQSAVNAAYSLLLIDEHLVETDFPSRGSIKFKNGTASYELFYKLLPVEPSLDVSAQTLDFHRVGVSRTGSRQLTLLNEGKEELSIAAMEIVPSDSAFSISNQSYKSVLKFRETSNLTLNFNPDSLGDQRANLVIRTNDPKHKECRVSLHGFVCAFEIQPTQLNFGNVIIGKTKKLSLTLENFLRSTLELRKLASNNQDFSLESASSLVIPGNQTQKIDVSFTPKTESYSSGWIVLEPDQEDISDCQIAVGGKGIQSNIAVIPRQVDFGKVRIGQRSQPVEIRIQNHTRQNCQILGISLSHRFLRLGRNPLNISQSNFLLIDLNTYPHDLSSSQPQPICAVSVQPKERGNLSGLILIRYKISEHRFANFKAISLQAQGL